LPITPWQRKQVLITECLRLVRVSASGRVSIHDSSLSSCAKKIGSRPARPIGDQRHSV
jgi:hypothetical protein